MTKMNGNGLNMVFKMIELISKAVFYHLYQNILPLFTINWPLFLKMDKKAYFLSKISSLLFQGNVPNVQHFFGEFRCRTLGAPGVVFPEVFRKGVPRQNFHSSKKCCEKGAVLRKGVPPVYNISPDYEITCFSR